MNPVYLNLTKDQFSTIGNAVASKKGTTLHLGRTQFVDEDKVSENTIHVDLNLKQVKRLQKKELVIDLSPAQCKNIVNRIKKIYGGALPLFALLPFIAKGAAVLGGLGAAASGVSQVVNAVNTKAHQDKLVSETTRHNKEMESKGSGVFLGPYKTGSGVYLKPYAV